uniref:Uncharacterized protein n=1 Tax=Arion vulgaris TaxID=1028688 RepID=A0A0B7B810_9EUPU
MEERKPLASHSNMSRLPVPGMRMKRVRSPDDSEAVMAMKKTRINSVDDKISTGQNVPTKSISSSSLSSVSSNKLAMTKKVRRSMSSSKLMKRPVGGTAAIRTISTVMAPRNTKPLTREISSTVVKSKPAAGVTGKPASLNNVSLNSTVTSTGAPKKRPVWDLKGRIQDMEAHIQQQNKDKSSFMGQFSKYNDRIGQLESQNQQLSTNVAQKEVASESAMKEIQNLQSKLGQTEEELRSTLKKFNWRLTIWSFKNHHLKGVN